MGWIPTIAALAISLGLAVLFGWAGARPPNLIKGPRLIPYRFLMLLAGVAVVLLMVHMKALAGLGQGR